MSLCNVGLSQINNSFSGAHYLPYAVGLLQTYVNAHAPEAGRYAFMPPLFSRVAVEEGAQALRHADVAGFSLYVWNERISLAIAARLKTLNPAVLIVCGGPQVPDRAEAFLRAHPYVDLAVHGEGEAVFLEILERSESRDWTGIPAISWLDRGDGRFRHQPKGQRLRDLDLIPSPYLSGVFADLMNTYPDVEWLALWETNRGCPFQCTFCDWGSATQTKVFRFGMDRLKSEMEWFASKQIEFIFCCDANFGILHRDVELARFAGETRVRTGYPRALSVQNTKNATDRAYEVQKVLADVGLNKGVTLSMQSLDFATLTNIKRDNISLDTYSVLQKRFTRDGVPTYSDLILGLPGETYDSFVEGTCALIEGGQHNRIQFNNLSVLPNAAMGDPAYLAEHQIALVESRILNMHGALTVDPEAVDEVQQLVISTGSMPPADWRQTRAFGWMTAFLHFDKIIQIPLILLHQVAGVPFRPMLERFMAVEAATHPMLADIRDVFLDRAHVIQQGGPEYEYSDRWLGIWWPHDEYALICLVVNDQLDAFYAEAEDLLSAILAEHGASAMEPMLAEAVRLNRALLKLPGQMRDAEITVGHNILEVYHGVLRGEPVPLTANEVTYRVLRSTQHWDDLERWCREVVWFANKKGAYLYGTEALEKYYAGHH